MILSALLTSVGINVGLCALFLTLYSIMRKWPSNAEIYVPRLAAEGEVQDGVGPSINWVKKAWQVTEDELLSNSGLDAVVFMRIFIFCIKVFRFAAIIGLLILLPFNYLGSQLSIIDFTDLPNKSMETFSISNVDDGSNKLWIHFSAVYVFTAVVCYYLYSEYDYIAKKRISYFYSSKPQPNQFTVLVRSIPDTPGRSYSETVETFFSEYYPSTYLSHSMVRRTSKLKGFINETGKTYKRIVHAKSESNTQESFKQTGFMGLFGRTDGQGHYDKNVDVEEHVRTGQSSVSGKEVSAAFVSFNSRLSAAVASHLQQGLKPTQWVTEPAPDPEDVYWPFFSESFVKVWLCKVAVFFACIFITALFVFPVLLVQGLTHLDQLERWLPFLKSILRKKVVSQVVTGYLPSLILQMFLSLVPPVMILLSSIQGYVALSQIEKSACIKMLWFTIWNVFFVNVPSGSALYMVDFVLEPRQIPELLAIAVPGQAAFFIAYVVTSGWTTTISTELFQLKLFIWSFLKKVFCCCKKSDHEEIVVPSNPYHQEIPRILFFSLLGITYFFLSPLILPFVLLYFCLGYIVYHNQLLSVYTPKFETGGKFWPVVHDATIFSLILMHVIAIGIFGLKKVPLASSLTIPLPILTLIFHVYCRRRFLPTFKGYPAECLINKDRSDQNDPTLSSFYDKLKTAYREPAMKAVRRSDSSESSSTTPLLQYGADN